MNLTSGLISGLLNKEWTPCLSTFTIFLKARFPGVIESRSYIIGWLSVCFVCLSLRYDVTLLKHVFKSNPFWIKLFDSYFLMKGIYVGFLIKWKFSVSRFINFPKAPFLLDDIPVQFHQSILYTWWKFICCLYDFLCLETPSCYDQEIWRSYYPVWYWY